MRATVVIAAAIGCALIGSGCGSTPAPVSPGPAREASFVRAAGVLQQQWATDVSEGVPTTAVAPLRHQLASSPFFAAPASSVVWLSADGHGLLASLDRQTRSAWTAAMVAARQSATTVIAAWTALVAQYGASVASTDVASASTWPADLARASTPAAITALLTGWLGVLDSARTTAAAAAALATSLAPYGGIAGLEAAAGSAVTSGSWRRRWPTLKHAPHAGAPSRRR